MVRVLVSRRRPCSICLEGRVSSMRRRDRVGGSSLVLGPVISRHICYVGSPGEDEGVGVVAVVS